MSIHRCKGFKLAAAILLTTLSWGSVAAVDSKAGRYYEDALSRYEKNDIPGAIIQLKNALQQDNKLLPVHLLLGKALFANGDVAGAEVAYSEALRLGVNRAEVVIPLARAVIAQGKPKAVLERPEFAPAGLPPGLQVQLLVLRASASADLGDTRGAMRAIEDARAIDPRMPDTWLAEVPVRIRARQFKEAADAAERALSVAPSLAEGWHQKASTLHAGSDLSGALAAYDRALQIDPNHAEARVARAGIYIDLSRYGEAAKDIAELQQRSPREPRAGYLKALLAERDGNPQAARAALLEVTGLIDPVPIDFIRFRPQLLLLNGLAHYSLGEPAKAKPYLELLLRAHGTSSAAKLLAQIHLSEGDATLAAPILEDYLRRQPGDAQAMMMLASAHMAKGRHQKATALMQEALKAQDTPALRTTLGLSLLQGGQAGDATTQFEAAFKKDTGQVQAGFALVGLYLRANQAAKAIAVAEAMLKRKPNAAAYYDLLGVAKSAARDTAGARGAFEQAVKLDARLTSAKLNLARLDIDAKAFDAAAQRLAALLKADERNVEALSAMAVLSERRGQSSEAQRWLEKARDHEGAKQTAAGRALVEFHLRQRQPAAALEAAKGILAKTPEDFGVLMIYARSQLAAGDAGSARAALSNAARVADFDPARQVEVALLQIAAGNPSGAQYSLEKALSTRPDFLPAEALMAEVELRQGETAKAERRGRSIAAAYPKRAVGHSLLADIALSRGQTAVAVDGYRKAHQIEPSTATLLRLFGVLARQDGGRAALPLAEQWLKSHPADLAVRHALADAHARGGNFPLARKAYEDLLKQAPDDASALNNLANVQLRMNDVAAAVRTAEQALAKDAGNPLILDTLGWALHRNGQGDRALGLLRDARLREPGNPDIRYHLAATLAKAGRLSEARDELESALKSGGGFEHKDDATRLLDTLK